MQLSRFGKAGRNQRRNPKGREGEISEAWKVEVNKDRNLTERRILKKIPFPVTIAKGFHLFPSRTQKLSPSASMVLGWRRPGRVDRRRIPITLVKWRVFFCAEKIEMITFDDELII